VQHAVSTPWPDLTSLELLTRVAELGSVGRAAASMGVSQASASRRLGTLETRCGLTLLVRTTTGSHLTAQGTVVVDWARSALDASRLLLSGLDALRHERAAQLRVAASMTIAEYLMPRWLASYLELVPQVEVGLRVVNSEAVNQLVLDGDADLGFIESPTAPRALRTHRVAWDRLVVVVAPGHPWSGRQQPVTVGELAATPLLVREQGSGTRVTLEHFLGRQHDMVAPLMQLESNSAVKVVAASGVAPAVLSRLAVADDLRDGRLVEVALRGTGPRRALRGVWSRGPRLTDAASALLRIAGADGTHAAGA